MNSQEIEVKNESTNSSENSIQSDMDVNEIKGFQQLTRAIGTQAQLQDLLPPDMYAKITAIEKSQRDHEILFGRLTTIIDELSERYSVGNYSPDRISSEGYASKNTNTSAEDMFEVSSNGESSASIDSIKIENYDSDVNHPDEEDNVNQVEDNYNNDNNKMDSSTEEDDEKEVEEYDDGAIRKSQRKIRPKIFSDMIYDSFSDEKQSIKSDNDKSFDITLLSSPDQSVISIQSVVSPKVRNNDVIQLGPHGTLVDVMDYNTIPWESASAATRKLLGYVFDIETLATHSLTGRPSPAFFGRERPLKNQLDAEKIADVIHAVIQKTGASERDIRAAITTKCADTTKMYKIKQNRMKKLSL